MSPTCLPTATASINAACLFCLLGTATTLTVLSHDTGPAPNPAAFGGRSLLSLGLEGPGPEVGHGGG